MNYPESVSHVCPHVLLRETMRGVCHTVSRDLARGIARSNSQGSTDQVTDDITRTYPHTLVCGITRKVMRALIDEIPHEILVKISYQSSRGSRRRGANFWRKISHALSRRTSALEKPAGHGQPRC